MSDSGRPYGLWPETEAGREPFLELKLVGTVRAVTSGWESGGDGGGRGKDTLTAVSHRPVGKPAEWHTPS